MKLEPPDLLYRTVLQAGQLALRQCRLAAIPSHDPFMGTRRILSPLERTKYQA